MSGTSTSDINITERNRTGILITLLVAAFVTSMSTTVTGNMIPNFMAYFDISSGLAQWLTSGANLLAGITIPVTAFFIKRTPNRAYFLTAMTAYTLGSLAAFLSFNFPMLLISRLLQAVGCGMLMSLAQVVLLRLYPKERHGTIMAAYSMAASVSSVVGPTYAGLIMDSFGWKGVFVSLFAVGMLMIAAGIVFMKNITPKEDAEINIFYVLLSSLGFTAFIIGVNNLSGGLVSLMSGGSMLLGAGLLALFSVLQIRSESPMLNLRVFRDSSFRIALIISLLLYFIAMGNAMILPIFSKTICGYSDSAFGMATILGALGSLAATMFAGHIYDRFGMKPLLFVGTGMFAVFSASGMFFDQDTSIIYIAIVNAFQGIGLAALISPTTTMALSELKGKERVDGSAILNTLRQVTSSLASTLSVLIYTIAGTGIPAVHVIFCYYGIVTLCILICVIICLRTSAPGRTAPGSAI